MSIKIAVISDVHANLEALEAVLLDIEALGVNTIISAGDSVGYGPNPDEVIKIMMERDIPSVMGNHDEAVVKKERLKWFNPKVRGMLSLTRDLLSDSSLAFLESLPITIERYGALWVHGCPPSSPRTYIYSVPPEGLKRILRKMAAPIAFVGHTHELEMVSGKDDMINRVPLSEGVVELDRDARHIINVGSVGQPRDRDKRAKYVIWEPESGRLVVRFIEYNAGLTAYKIISMGFPEYYASRLL